MKTMSKFLIITAAFVFSASQDLHAFENDYAQEVREIEKLESEQNWKAAAIYSASLSLKVGQDIRINKVVVSDKWSLNIGDNSLDQFKDQIKKKVLNHENNLRQYLVKKEENLWLLKMSTVKALQLSLKLSQTEQAEIAALMSRAVKESKGILFYGILDTKFCRKITYFKDIYKTRETKVDEIDIFGDHWTRYGAEDYLDDVEEDSYNKCDDLRNNFKISVNDEHSARLYQADLLISSYEKQVSLPDFVEP